MSTTGKIKPAQKLRNARDFLECLVIARTVTVRTQVVSTTAGLVYVY